MWVRVRGLELEQKYALICYYIVRKCTHFLLGYRVMVGLGQPK